MILTLRCTHAREPDGSYRLQPDRLAAPFTTPPPFVISGALARFWEILVEIAGRPAEEQESLLAELPSRAVNTVAKLERANVLEVGVRRAAEVRVPLDKLHLEITNRCNFSCRACYLGAARRPVRGCGAVGEASTERWEEAIRQAAELGCRDAVVTGGEPLVRRDVFEIAAALRRHSIRCVVNSNVSCVTEKVARELAALGVWAVDATIYGFDRASAADYTGVAQAYRAALDGIRRLVAHGIHVRAKCFGAEGGAHDYGAVRRELEPLGVRVHLNQQVIHGDVFTGRSAASGRARVAPAEFVQETTLPCAPGKTCLHVGPTGEARPCTKLNVTLGNAFTDGLGGVWSSRVTEDFRRFWVRYCADAGFVRGARVRSCCPASEMLSRPSGLADFAARWCDWRRATGGGAQWEPQCDQQECSNG